MSLPFCTDFTNMSVDTIRYKCNKMSIMAPTHPAFNCRVVLDRLEQSTIEQIMNNSLATAVRSFIFLFINVKDVIDTLVLVDFTSIVTTNVATISSSTIVYHGNANRKDNHETQDCDHGIKSV